MQSFVLSNKNYFVKSLEWILTLVDVCDKMKNFETSSFWDF